VDRNQWTHVLAQYLRRCGGDSTGRLADMYQADHSLSIAITIAICETRNLTALKA